MDEHAAAIAVERRLLCVVNGRKHLLTEDEARALVTALMDGLGVAAPAPMGRAAVVAAAAPPAIAALPSGPAASEEVVAAPPRAVYVDGRGLKMGDWSEDVPELRRLMAEGVPLKEIARRLNRPLPATSAKFYALKRAHPAEPPAEDAPAVAADPEPVASPPRPAHAGGEWLPWQTKALIRAMARDGGGIAVAVERTGHTHGSCALRWRHLKEAGIMRVEDYLKDQESVASDGR